MLLLFFLLSAIIPTAARKDGGFSTWCMSDFLASSHDTGKPHERLLDKEMKCQQSYDFPGVSSSSAASICAKRSPFLVDSATAKEGIVTCVWKRTGECNEGHYIHKYCYKLVPKCTGSWKLYRVDGSDESRWLALYYFKSKVAKVAVPSSQKIAKMKYSRGVLQPTTDEESKSLEKVVVLNRMPPFGVNPGDIVYLEKGQEAQSICREKARNEPDTSIEPGGPGGGGTTLSPGGGVNPTVPGGGGDTTLSPGGGVNPTAPDGGNPTVQPGGGGDTTLSPGGRGNPTMPGGVNPTVPGGVNPTTPDGGNPTVQPGGGVTPPGSGAVGGGGNQPYTEIRAKDGSFVLHILANLYTPKLDTNGNIDFKYFHQVCNNIVDGAYAATPQYLDDALVEHKLGDGRYYLPGGRGFISMEVDCDKNTYDASDLSKWKMLLHLNHLINGNHYATVDAKHWKKGLPNKECSDQGRYALAFQEGKTIDVPIFDRLPIICVTGSVPALPRNVHGECRKNSVPDASSESGCKCKAGFVDVLSLTKKEHIAVRDYARSQEIPKGYVCVKINCGVGRRRVGVNIDAILFVIDGSGSINFNYTCNPPCRYPIDYFNLLRDFVYDGATWLPREIRILLLQYSTERYRDWVPTYLYGHTAKNWDGQQYRDAAANAINDYLGVGTPTYEAIELMTKYWLAENPLPLKAQMYVITDGVANGQTDEPYRRQVIKKARDNGIYIKYVTVGGLIDLGFINEDVLDQSKDIIQLKDYVVLKKDLPRIIAQSWCDELTIADYEDAAKPPYQ